jgi:glucokinase
MTLSPSQACIGVDVGGTNLRLALVDSGGAILLRERMETAIELGRDSFLARLVDGIAAIRRGAEDLGIPVQGVGLGVPGLVNASGLVLSSPNLRPIDGVNIADWVTRATGLPAVVVNDANAAAFGEQQYGAGRSFGSLLLLTLGTGVGSGLVLSGQLWRGMDGVAAEYGHATMEPDGQPCPCGNRGCLEQYASAGALVRGAIEKLKQGAGGLLAVIPPDEVTAAVIAAAARQGDELAVALFEQAGRYLGIAAATIVNLLNLEAIVLAGGVAASFELLVGPMQREIARRAFGVTAGRVRVVKGELGDDAGILGAAALASAHIIIQSRNPGDHHG